MEDQNSLTKPGAGPRAAAQDTGLYLPGGRLSGPQSQRREPLASWLASARPGLQAVCALPILLEVMCQDLRSAAGLGPPCLTSEPWSPDVLCVTVATATATAIFQARASPPGSPRPPWRWGLSPLGGGDEAGAPGLAGGAAGSAPA